MPVELHLVLKLTPIESPNYRAAVTLTMVCAIWKHVPVPHSRALQHECQPRVFIFAHRGTAVGIKEYTRRICCDGAGSDVLSCLAQQLKFPPRSSL